MHVLLSFFVIIMSVQFYYFLFGLGRLFDYRTLYGGRLKRIDKSFLGILPQLLQPFAFISIFPLYTQRLNVYACLRQGWKQNVDSCALFVVWR